MHGPISSTESFNPTSLTTTGHWGYRSYREHLADRFGDLRLRKLCLNAGFTCPNIDGTVAKGGCTYCNNDGFVPSLASPDAIRDQWDRGRKFLRRRHRKSVDGFIAYFQAFSNTYAPLADLQKLYDPLPDSLPECHGVSISTRPDCMEDEKIDYFDEMGKRTFLTIEMGCQSDNDQALRATNRGHDFACFLDAVERCANKNFEICAHFILGLPFENENSAVELGKLTASLPIHSVKIHNLHIMRGTPMERAWRAKPFAVPELHEWIDLSHRFVDQLRPDQSVQRIIADAPDRLLLSGGWCQDKQRFLRLYGQDPSSIWDE